MLDYSNADFDVNILENCFDEPGIELTFPLPTDRETYVDLEGNQSNVSHTWSVLQNFVNYISGVNWDKIYATNEYKYSINKYSTAFNDKMESYMQNRLTHSDESLDELVDNLVNQELRLNLIQGKDYQKRFAEVKNFMVKYYTLENNKNLPRYMTRNMMRVCYVTVMTLFRKMFPGGIWCNREEFLNMYRIYLDDPMSIIFLPNHQSHIDYIMLHLIAIRFQISTPTVIAGDNLNVAIFGNMLKGLGAIFIKRSFNNELYTERNLANYIEFILLNKVHFEVFVEGTRSRDGKLLLPKYGILKTLANIYCKQRDEEDNNDFDMLMQPVSITYERIYEADGYLKELMGKDKKQESGLSILKNGISHYFRPAEAIGELSQDYDNSTRHLHGKVFIKLGNQFKLSEFVEEDLKSKHLDTTQIELVPGSKINLKKLGFKVLHEINRCAYLPEISIIGSAIQTHYNLYKRKSFDIFQLVPILRLLIESFSEQEVGNETNLKLLNNINSYSDKELVQLIREQVPQFFRDIKINFPKNQIEINDSMELLYYKNITVHIIIHKLLASFILLSLPDHMRTKNILHKMYYIFTGFLKNEFLFDYDYNDRHKLSSIVKELENTGKIEATTLTPELVAKRSEVGGRTAAQSQAYKVIDRHYLNCFSEIVKPFLESYLLCIYNLNEIITTFNESHGLVNFKKLLIDDTGIDYPHTKTLLKTIQDKQKLSKEITTHIESTNKQYLLSCLYYLNHLQLIDIVKNKRRTKAFVLITNGKDLLFVYKFLVSLIKSSNNEGNGNFINDTTVAYMIDIIDKNFEREVEYPNTNSNEVNSLVNVKLRSKI